MCNWTAPQQAPLFMFSVLLCNVSIAFGSLWYFLHENWLLSLNEDLPFIVFFQTDRSISLLCKPDTRNSGILVLFQPILWDQFQTVRCDMDSHRSWALVYCVYISGCWDRWLPHLSIHNSMFMVFSLQAMRSRTGKDMRGVAATSLYDLPPSPDDLDETMYEDDIKAETPWESAAVTSSRTSTSSGELLSIPSSTSAKRRPGKSEPPGSPPSDSGVSSTNDDMLTLTPNYSDHIKKSPPTASKSAARKFARRRKALSARERNLRRIESNERERQRMHSLNDAFGGTQICHPSRGHWQKAVKNRDLNPSQELH